MNRVVLDTCAWIWHCSERRRLSTAAAEAIGDALARRQAYLSVISCWEVTKLVEKGKLAFRVPVGEWMDRALALKGLVLEPLSPAIAIASTQLPGKFHGDPADQLIVATTRAMGAVLVTADREIRGYPHVAVVW